MTWHYTKIAARTVWYAGAFIGTFMVLIFIRPYFKPIDNPVSGLYYGIICLWALSFCLSALSNLLKKYNDEIENRIANPIQQYGSYWYIYSKKGMKMSKGYTSYVAALRAQAIMGR